MRTDHWACGKLIAVCLLMFCASNSLKGQCGRIGNSVSIDGYAPASPCPGTKITVTGDGFPINPFVGRLYIDGQLNFTGTWLNDTTMEFTLPMGASDSVLIEIRDGPGTSFDADCHVIDPVVNEVADFFYPDNLFCKAIVPETVSVGLNPGSSALGGVASALPTPTWFGPMGSFDLQALPLGLYSITLETANPTPACRDRQSFDFRVVDKIELALTYPLDTVCGALTPILSPDSLLNRGNDSIHIFSGPANGFLDLDPLTGIIQVSNSTSGVYTLELQSDGLCGDRVLTTVTVQNQSPLFSYPVTVFCQSSSNVFPQTISPSGYFTASPSGLNLRFNDGRINVGASAPGVYTVTHTLRNACNQGYSVQVHILGNQASFSYPGGALCSNQDSIPLLIPPGTGGGLFAVSGGMQINTLTGSLFPAPGQSGSFTVNYRTPSNAYCQDVFTTSVSLTPQDIASIQYQGPVCPDSILLYPNQQSGLGVFSAIAPGLVIDSVDGAVDVAASSPGTHQVQFISAAACPDTVIAAVNIYPPEQALFTYSDSLLCQNLVRVAPILLPGTNSGGVFTATNGLVLDPQNGEIDLLASPVISSTVTYTTQGPCPVSVQEEIKVVEPPNADFFYDELYCSNQTNPIPDSVRAAGTFSCSSSNLVFADPSTGEIDLVTSLPGSYRITFVALDTSSLCANTFSDSLEIRALNDQLSIDYVKDTFCRNASWPIPVVSNNLGWGGLFYNTSPTFSFGDTTGNVSPSGVVAIDSCTPGDYWVIFESNNVCALMDSFFLTIQRSDDASISYPNPVYCLSEPNPAANITGTRGGNFYSLDSNLIISNSLSGEIDLWASDPGFFQVAYRSVGTCPDTGYTQIQLLDGPRVELDSIPLSVCPQDTLKLEIIDNRFPSDQYSFAVNSQTLYSGPEELYTLPLEGLPDSTWLRYCGFSSLSGCRHCDSLLIEVKPEPAAILEDSSSLFPGVDTRPWDLNCSVGLSSSTDSTYFDWNLFPTNQPDSLLQSGRFGPVFEGFWDNIDLEVDWPFRFSPYPLQLEIRPVARGCPGKSTLLNFVILPRSDINEGLFVPELITPDGNNMNDRWEIRWAETIRPEEYRIEVFNDFGGLVKKFDSLFDAQNWNGERLPGGVYWFVLYEKEGNLPVLKSGLTLIK